MATTYRKRSLFGIELTPRWTVRISSPFYPDSNLPPVQARIKLRDNVYDFIREQVMSTDNYQYIMYEKLDEADQTKTVQ